MGKRPHVKVLAWIAAILNGIVLLGLCILLFMEMYREKQSKK
jgi:hypothetical protein